MSSFNRISNGLALIALLPMFAAAAPVATPPSPPAQPLPTSQSSANALSNSTNESVNQMLKQAVMDSAAKLPPMEPWQKKIFEEEVVPQYQRFIRDYRPSQVGMNVDVDLETLANYLRFHGTKYLKAEKPEKPEFRVLVLLREGEDCSKCMAAAGTIKALLKGRLERRGLTPTWLASGELGPVKLSGKLLDAKLDELTSEKRAFGWLRVSWLNLPPEDIDSAHADENHFQIEVALSLRDVPKEAARLGGKLDVLETQSFENALVRLMTDDFATLGAKIAPAGQGAAVLARAELLLQVTGFKTFANLVNVKKILQTQITAIQSLEDRQVARNQVILAAGTTLGRDDLEKAIRALAFELVDGERIRVEVLP